MKKVSSAGFYKSLLIGDKAGRQSAVKGRSTSAKENALIEAIDNADLLIRYADQIEKLNKGKMDAREFLDELSAPALVTLLWALNNTNTPKDKAAIAQDILDRAGHSKINKVAMGTKSFDRNSSKEELIASLLGMARGTNFIEIEE